MNLWAFSPLRCFLDSSKWDEMFFSIAFTNYSSLRTSLLGCCCASVYVSASHSKLEPHSGPSTWECLTLITGFYSCMLNEWLGRRAISWYVSVWVLLAKKLPGRSVITSCVFIQTITLAINSLLSSESSRVWLADCFAKWTADAVLSELLFPNLPVGTFWWAPRCSWCVTMPFFSSFFVSDFDQQCGNVDGNVRERRGGTAQVHRWVAPGLVRVTIKLSQQRAG